MCTHLHLTVSSIIIISVHTETIIQNFLSKIKYYCRNTITNLQYKTPLEYSNLTEITFKSIFMLSQKL